MKLKIYTLLLALCVTWSLQSCDNDDDNSIAVPTELQNAFASKYPNAANVKWDDNAVFIDIYFKIYIHFFQFDPIIDGAICFFNTFRFVKTIFSILIINRIFEVHFDVLPMK